MGHQLLLVRHAKSSWDDFSLNDFDRPLAPRGIRALEKMAAHLQTSEASPDLVLCSTAVRTRATLDGLRSALPGTAAVDYVDAIYGASTRTLLGLVRGVDEKVGCLLLVGHNPATQELALALAGGGEIDLRHRMWEKYPTGAIATLSFEGTWSEVGHGDASLDDYFVPRRPRP